jgi:DNA-binding winged helix-turn-helix (wHTH) protein
MKYQNLIIFKLNSLYQVLKEIEKELHFSVFKINNENLLYSENNDLKNNIVISNFFLPNVDNQCVLDQVPIKVSKLVEKLNVIILRKQFSDQLDIKVKNYLINFNSRELSSKDQKIKLTEKEISVILYLFKKKTATSIKELKENVWQYHSDIETHTVETHIYRLRKKIVKIFNDEKFILSKKDGYQIK